MELFTSYYYHPALRSGDYYTVRISQGTPRFLKYTLDNSFPEIMPSWSMIKMTDFEEYQRQYLNLLERIGIDIISCRIEFLQQVAAGKPLVLLCYEDLRKPELWCHRTIFAEWWRQQTGVIILELAQEPLRQKIIRSTLFDMD
jgi:hypothetical protein